MVLMLGKIFFKRTLQLQETGRRVQQQQIMQKVGMDQDSQHLEQTSLIFVVLRHANNQLVCQSNFLMGPVNLKANIPSQLQAGGRFTGC